jgi:hypothetical protein
VLHIRLSLVHVAKMGCVIQLDPLRLWDVIKKWLHRHILGLVLHGINQERRDFNLVQFRDNCPVAKGARDCELTRAIPIL